MKRRELATLIHERVELARQGLNPYVICRMKSGWLVVGDVQPVPGYCLLLADPVVESINVLNEAGRTAYCLDTVRIGDALLEVTGAWRINYETWGNNEAALHTHIVPRYLSEPQDKRRRPAVMSYSWATARKFDPEQDRPFVDDMRRRLVG